MYYIYYSVLYELTLLHDYFDYKISGILFWTFDIFRNKTFHPPPYLPLAVLLFIEECMHIHIQRPECCWYIHSNLQDPLQDVQNKYITHDSKTAYMYVTKLKLFWTQHFKYKSKRIELICSAYKRKTIIIDKKGMVSQHQT